MAGLGPSLVVAALVAAVPQPAAAQAVSILADVSGAPGESGMFVGSLRASALRGWYVVNASQKDDTACIRRGYTESTMRCDVPIEHAHDASHAVSLLARAASRDNVLRLDVDARSDVHRPIVIPGGLLVGVGGQIGDGFRMRGGYELAVVSRNALLSGSVDTDFSRTTVSALTLKGVTTTGFFGGGLGVPVRLAPELASGVRLEGDVFLGPVGFVTTADIWLFAPEKVHATFTLLGVVSF